MSDTLATNAIGMCFTYYRVGALAALSLLARPLGRGGDFDLLRLFRLGGCEKQEEAARCCGLGVICTKKTKHEKCKQPGAAAAAAVVGMIDAGLTSAGLSNTGAASAERSGWIAAG
jgi:hypothetical protein